MEKKSVKTTARVAWEASDALAVLAGQRWPNTSVALAIARTFRKLRGAYDEIDKDRRVALEQYAVKQEDGSYLKEADGQVRLSDPQAFTDEWRKILDEECEVEIYPVSIKMLGENGKKAKFCEKCHQPVGLNLSAFQLETLVELGAIVVEDEGKPEPASD